MDTLKKLCKTVLILFLCNTTVNTTAPSESPNVIVNVQMREESLGISVHPDDRVHHVIAAIAGHFKLPASEIVQLTYNGEHLKPQSQIRSIMIDQAEIDLGVITTTLQDILTPYLLKPKQSFRFLFEPISGTGVIRLTLISSVNGEVFTTDTVQVVQGLISTMPGGIYYSILYSRDDYYNPSELKAKIHIIHGKERFFNRQDIEYTTAIEEAVLEPYNLFFHDLMIKNPALFSVKFWHLRDDTFQFEVFPRYCSYSTDDDPTNRINAIKAAIAPVIELILGNQIHVQYHIDRITQRTEAIILSD